MAPPNRPPPRTLEVIASRFVTPNMLRVTLGGPGLDGFPEEQAGGYVKLRLPVPATADKRVVRTYTIRHQRADAIDIDFALHGAGDAPAGPATEWALAARPGDSIEVGGPGPAKPLPAGAEFYLVAGDMTALPAISVNLEQLAPDARGLAIVEVQGEDDRQDLVRPEGVDLHWVINPHPGGENAPLAGAVRATEVPASALYGWVACEFVVMKALRDYLRGACGLGPDQLYISSYWKRGITEEEHKVIKREDAELTV